MTIKKLLIIAFICLSAYSYAADNDAQNITDIAIDFAEVLDKGHYDVVKNMLDEGLINVNLPMNLNLPLHLNRTPLMHVLKTISTPKLLIVKLLLDKGANIEERDDQGRTPLMIVSSMSNKRSVVKLLLDHGANINSSDNFQLTALSLALRSSKIDTAKLLFARGAIPQEIDFIKAASLGLTNIVQELLNLKVNINKIDDDKRTALMKATVNNHVPIVKLLLKNNANVNMQDNNGCTALMMASTQGHIEIIQLLLDNEAEINARHKITLTGLMFAVWQGHAKTVQLLLDHGANVDLKDRGNRTAHDLALKKGHKEIVEMLDCYKNTYKPFIEERKRAIMLLVQKGNGGFRKNGTEIELPNVFCGDILKLAKFKFSDFYNNKELIAQWVKECDEIQNEHELRAGQDALEDYIETYGLPKQDIHCPIQ